MIIMNDLWLHRYSDGTFKTNIPGYPEVLYSNSFSNKINAKLEEIYSLGRKRTFSDEERALRVQPIIEEVRKLYEEHKAKSVDVVKATATIQSLMNFFSEFGVEPNFRFINTLANAAKTSTGREYVCNYFSLTDHQYKNSIIEKTSSVEFASICNDLADYITVSEKTPINTRFKLFYGSAGTGKTTKAIEEAKGNVMICHSAMLPSDLMEDFEFVDGNPNFRPSALQIALTTGKKIVLDEINLLPFESLRFLQSILDGKKEFVYKGETKTIADGFQIIGTMNLQINGSVFSLPEPLVDRAAELKEFKLTANDLLAAIL